MLSFTVINASEKPIKIVLLFLLLWRVRELWEEVVCRGLSGRFCHLSAELWSWEATRTEWIALLRGCNSKWLAKLLLSLELLSEVRLLKTTTSECLITESVWLLIYGTKASGTKLVLLLLLRRELWLCSKVEIHGSTSSRSSLIINELSKRIFTHLI